MSKVHNDGPVCFGCEKMLETAHPYMRDWFHRKKQIHPDLHVAWAWRGKDDQNKCLAEGSSQKAWPNGPHNRMVPIDPAKPFDPADDKSPNARPESLALDVFQINSKYPHGCWDMKFMSKLNDENVASGEVILWGGQWKSLGDGTHYQYAGPL